MKQSDLSSKTRFLSHWIHFAAASLLAVTLVGCGGGGDGGGGAAPVVPVVPPAGAAPVVPVPPGAPLAAGPLTPAQFAALNPVVPAVAVTVASAPKVTFSLTNGVGGPPITGIGSKSQNATATVATFPNLAFSLAKLVPGALVPGSTARTPSRWVSYIVTTVPTTTTASVPTRPSTDTTGTLVDNGNGTYTYTFFRDVAAVKAQVAAATLTGNNVAADLDDLTFDPTLVHRLTIQVYGNAPGTGSNTPTGVTTTPGVPITNPVNRIFDFVPARVSATNNGAVTAADPAREIVATSKCNECHKNLGGFPGASESTSDATFHGGNRNNTQYCVVCHTEQRKYGRVEAAIDPANPNNYLPGGSTNKINGFAAGYQATNIHKIHMSANLTKTGYDYGGVIYEEACKFPQDVRNCTKCHEGSATTTPGTEHTAQGDNWMNVPNRAACGACHDGINFATGAGVTLANKIADVQAGVPVGTTATGHVGGARPNDLSCALCHDAATIPINHLAVTAPNPNNALVAGGTDSRTNSASIASNSLRLPAGAIKVTHQIFSVSLNASRNPVMVFRLLQNGVRTDLNVFNPANPVATQEIWPNYMGAPSVYFVYAVPQDGIAKPADFNASASTYLRSLWNGTATGASAGTLTGPGATGFYTATITGATIPTNAVMLTGGLGYTYQITTTLPLTQTNVPGYPTAGPIAGQTNRSGGLIVLTPNAQTVATGFTPRRAIVADALCNKCHQELGTFTEDVFHAGQRNDGTTCSWCHNPNRASSGWSADSISFVHGIHAAAKRTTPYNWHAVLNPDGSILDSFASIGYPGILQDCETCHLPGTYDFSAPGSVMPFPNNRQYRLVASGTFPSTPRNDAVPPATLVPRDVNFGAGFAVDANGAPTAAATTVANSTNLVTSPIATVCFACHDDGLTISHMRINGGSIYEARGFPAVGAAPATGALAKIEQCAICHVSPTSPQDIRTAHARR